MFKVGDVIYSEESGNVIEILEIDEGGCVYVWINGLKTESNNFKHFIENPGPHSTSMGHIDRHFKKYTKLHKALL